MTLVKKLQSSSEKTSSKKINSKKSMSKKSRQQAAFLRFSFLISSLRMPRVATLRAVSVVVGAGLLNGCASGGNSPLDEALTALLPDKAAANAQASEISFASLMVNTSDRQGLLVLGAMGGPATFWPTGNNSMISLYHGGLQATAGLPEDLLTTRYFPLDATEAADYVPWQQATPVEYRLERLWEDNEGLTRALGATARLTCEAPTVVAYPLGEQRVERCVSHRQWDDGSNTRATLWRDAHSKRLWAVDEVPWPEGPRIQWEVARPWW